PPADGRRPRPARGPRRAMQNKLRRARNRAPPTGDGTWFPSFGVTKNGSGEEGGRPASAEREGGGGPGAVADREIRVIPDGKRRRREDHRRGREQREAKVELAAGAVRGIERRAVLVLVGLAREQLVAEAVRGGTRIVARGESVLGERAVDVGDSEVP